ncbi:MAG TPA: PAS domain S-box protein [Candidatus Angelobacter sp.]|nr:PAS domain S-box protein [Candidatus Angelobacter sp.]
MFTDRSSAKRVKTPSFIDYLHFDGELGFAVLNSLTDHIAVLDREGTIIAVNEAWNKFALENGAPDTKRLSVGTNYMEVCRAALLRREKRAAPTLEGIGSVLSGKKKVFRQEYALHTPDESRWFAMSVYSLCSPGGGAVIVHSDITEAKLAWTEIEANDDRFRLMAENAPIFIWICNESAKCTYVNKRWLAHTGRPIQEELGDGWLESVHPEDRAGVKKRFLKAFATRSPFELEYRLRNASGQYQWIIDCGAPFYSSEGFRGYVGSALDITEYKRGLKTAKLESLYVRLLLNVSKSIHNSTGIKNTVQECLRHVCGSMKWPIGHARFKDSASRQPHTLAEAWHFSESEHKHSEMTELLNRFTEASESSLRQKQALWSALDTEAVNSPRSAKTRGEPGIRAVIAIPIVIGGRAAGSIEFGLTESERPGRTLLNVMKSVGAELARFIERKNTQHAFEAGNQQNRAFFEKASVGAAQVDPAGRFIRVNDAICKITGYSRGELLRMRFSDYTHPEDRIVDEKFNKLVRGEILSYKNEKRIIRKTGETVWVQVDVTMTRDKAGKPLYTAGILQNITQRKQGEAALLKANEEVETLAARLINAQEEERSRIARELHDGVGQHAVSLALAIAALQTSVQQWQTGSGRASQDLDRELVRLKKYTVELADGIRELSHELHPAVLEHAGFVSAVRALCEEFRRRENMRIELAIEKGLQLQNKEGSLGLYRILQEALQNIRRHAHSKRVAISLSSSQGSIRLAIRDFGVGFDPTVARAKNSLGMISMQERTRILGGTFHLTTSAKQGTEIMIEIPENPPQIRRQQELSPRRAKATG